MKKNRILTESGAYFPRCVALPARETLLLEEEMMLYMGQSGGSPSSGSRSKPTPVVIPSPVIAADATKTISNQMPEEIKKIEDAAAWGVIRTGNTDSARTSGRRVAEDIRNTVVDTSSSTPTNSDSTTEDTSESCCLLHTVLDWVGL